MEMAEKIRHVRLMGMFRDDLKYPNDMVEAYLNMAGQVILNKAYPFDDTVEVVPAKYEYKQIEIAIYLMGKIGAEGQTYHSENGINRTYESADVPPSMLRGITPMGVVVK